MNATADYIVFKHGDVRASYYDQASVHVVLFEAWTASQHHIRTINASNSTAQLSNPFAGASALMAKANQGGGGGGSGNLTFKVQPVVVRYLKAPCAKRAQQAAFALGPLQRT